MRFDTKIAVVVRDDLEAWQRLNVTAFLASGIAANPDLLGSIGYAIDINLLKVATSQSILGVIEKCLLICGILGYKNGTPFSLGRHLRDAHSARLMISNDRVLMNTSSLLLVSKQDASLLG